MPSVAVVEAPTVRILALRAGARRRVGATGPGGFGPVVTVSVVTVSVVTDSVVTGSVATTSVGAVVALRFWSRASRSA